MNVALFVIVMTANDYVSSVQFVFRMEQVKLLLVCQLLGAGFWLARYTGSAPRASV